MCRLLKQRTVDRKQACVACGSREVPELVVCDTKYMTTASWNRRQAHDADRRVQYARAIQAEMLLLGFTVSRGYVLDAIREQPRQQREFTNVWYTQVFLWGERYVGVSPTDLCMGCVWPEVANELEVVELL